MGRGRSPERVSEGRSCGREHGAENEPSVERGGIVASGGDQAADRPRQPGAPPPHRGDAEGRAAPPPRRLAARRHGAGAGSDARHGRARDWAGMSAALIAPMPCADQAELLRAFDLPIALMQDAEALERITRELVETKAADGVRYVEIRWGPRLHVARGLSLADGIAAVCAGARDGGRPDRDGRATDLHRAALARPGRERRAGRDRGPLPRRRAHGLGSGRPRGRLPRPARPRARVRGGPRARPADHDPCRGVGRRGAGPPRPRGRAGAHRPRPGRHRRPGLVRRAARPRDQPRPVPDLELAGGHRAVASRPTRWRGSTARACR